MIEKYGKTAGWITAMLILAGIIWGVTDDLGIRYQTNGEAAEQHESLEKQIGEVRVVAQSNGRQLLLQEWDYLVAKMKVQALSTKERIRYCEIANILKFEVVGCAAPS